MKRLEVILKRHDKQMLVHHKLYLAGKTSLHNQKIYNETYRSILSWFEQQCENNERNAK